MEIVPNYNLSDDRYIIKLGAHITKFDQLAEDLL